VRHGVWVDVALQPLPLRSLPVACRLAGLSALISAMPLAVLAQFASANRQIGLASSAPGSYWNAGRPSAVGAAPRCWEDLSCGSSTTQKTVLWPEIASDGRRCGTPARPTHEGPAEMGGETPPSPMHARTREFLTRRRAVSGKSDDATTSPPHI
jgi:hypothetical protein